MFANSLDNRLPMYTSAGYLEHKKPFQAPVIDEGWNYDNSKHYSEEDTRVYK